MTRGRIPLPDAVKALKGNPGKRRLKLGETDDATAPANSSSSSAHRSMSATRRMASTLREMPAAT
jgi:hypothetical protein